MQNIYDFFISAFGKIFVSFILKFILLERFLQNLSFFWRWTDFKFKCSNLHKYKKVYI